MNYAAAHTIASILREVATERARQEQKWGQQNHPNGTGPDEASPWLLPYIEERATWLDIADEARSDTEGAARRGKLTYRQILLKEVTEALAEDDPAKLRAELVQVAAVAAAWVEKIDRDTAGEP